MKNLLLLKGGGGSEHEISVTTAKYISENIESKKFNIIEVEIKADKKWYLNEELCELSFSKKLTSNNQTYNIDLAIPALHGYPGETGDIQSYFEMIDLPYLGCNSESSKVCFNKALTKLWLEKVSIPTTDFLILNDLSAESVQKANDFYTKNNGAFVKAATQGSSVGCYPIKTNEELLPSLEKAFGFSQYVLVERLVNARELEIAVFEYKNEIIATHPSEVLCPHNFYSYEEKYSNASATNTILKAEIKNELVTQMKDLAISAYKTLKLNHLSRLDFFILESGEMLLNEVNTFPGMTPISMFPKMMEEHGIKFNDFLSEHLSLLAK